LSSIKSSDFLEVCHIDWQQNQKLVASFTGWGCIRSSVGE
jgi:hypothetical protein